LRILLTNDDGVQAHGLRTLQEQLEDLGETLVVAPTQEQSASSHALTLSRPLRLERIRPGVFSVDGTPTDCVLLAVRGVGDLVRFRPDLIVSGVNHGPNLGDDVTYSGTVAAAFEGHLLGVPSIAFSSISPDPARLEDSARAARCLIEQVLARRPSPRLLLNVNVPDLPYDELQGFRLTHLGKRVYSDVVVERQDPRGRPYYWIAGSPSWEEEENSDQSAIDAGFVSITPLHLELTQRSVMREMAGWDLSLADG
jgi:5'-nucleotidase